MMNKSADGKFPLSLSQQNILNLERVLMGTSVNNISTTIRIEGHLDFPVLQKCIGLILESDASLRTRLTEENGTILQYHVPYEKEEFPVYDFSNTSREGVANWEDAVTREPIPLFGGALYRFILFKDAETSGGVLVKLHHIIADGWSQIMLCNKIAGTYLDLLAGKTPDLPAAPDYALHVEEEQEYLKSKAHTRDEAYWKEIVHLADEPSVLKSINSAAISPVGRRLSFTFPEILNHAIYSYCEKHRVAPFAVYYMALATYFKRNGGANSFTIGVPIFNRTNYTFKQSTGMFVTTLPFYHEINDEWSFNQFNEKMTENWLEMLRHQRYPFSSITELAGGGRLFNIALSYQDSKIYESRDATVAFSGRWHYCGYQAEQLTIHLTNLTTHRQYAVDYDYLAQFFSEEEIGELHRNVCHILSEALSNPDQPIHRLNILSMEQKEELIYSFNRTDRYLAERSVYQALAENNARHPNRAALIQNGERMTYGALFLRSSQFAAHLASMNLNQDPLVAIHLPRSFDLMAAMVGCLEMGGAFLLIPENLPDERIKKILTQSGAAALITLSTKQSRFEGMQIPVLFADELLYRIPRYAEPAEEADVLPGDKLAYVVYTSGSTGDPKGVEITQRNLLNLAQEMESVYGSGAVLSVCSIGFDAFMLESMAALLNGRTIVLPMDNETDSPERLAALMNGYAVDFLAITPSRLAAFLRSETFRKVMWRMSSIVCGGEPFPPELLKKIKNCTQARIYNQYGPSEATVAVSMKEISHTDKITIGTPLGNCKLYVLDQWLNPLPIGGNGKLFVGGKCVGRGYRNRPELTAKSFRENPFVYNDRIYDTGDMAYWTPNGEIVLTGRADRQIKLRGLRIELQEISACLESFPGVTAAYARVCEISGQEVLGAYYTAEYDVTEADLLAHAATYLPVYMIPVFILRVQDFRTTVNGKVDEKSLPLPELHSRIPHGKASATAEKIAEIFREVLDNDELTADSDYFLYGGNSLNMLNCLLRLEETFHVKLRTGDLYACRTASRLADRITGSNGEAHEDAPSAHTLRKAPARGEYPLTHTQQGIYVQSAFDPSGLAYNMPGAFEFSAKPDLDRLRLAFDALIRQDPIFRTAFIQGPTGVSAKICEDVSFVLEEISGDSFEEVCEKFLRPFDLSRAPLLRAAIWEGPDGKFCLLLDSHHIIGDGMSTSVVLQRLDRLYAGNSPDGPWNFYDYVYTCEQNAADDRSDMLAYWTEQLDHLPDPLVIPGDRPRAKKFDFAGNACEHFLSGDVSEKIAAFCGKSGYSEYVVFLAAYGILLSAVSDQKDIVIGAPVAGRDYLQSEEICGPFINTLPLRLKLDRDYSVGEWLQHVRGAVSGMLDHQHIGLEEIISSLDLPRGELNGLYRVMLTQSPVDEEAFCLDRIPLRFQAIPTGTVKMDMILELAKKNNGYALRFSYASSLFDPETIAFYGRCMEQIIGQLIQNSEKTIRSLPLLAPMDQEKYIDEPNYRATPFLNQPIQQIIKRKTAALSEETAIIWHDRKISYGEVERRACAIAQHLEECGVKSGSCVALCLKRTPDMIAAMYGVLKAGCSYMFMLNSFPDARLRYMLEISEASVVLYDQLPQSLAENPPECPMYTLPMGEAEDYCDRPVMDDSLVNVLFTSGSTGQPKGVMLRHRSVSNLYSQMKTLLDPIEGNVLCSTNSVFDCFIVETMIALAMGRCVVLADEEEMMVPWKLAGLVAKYNTGIFEMTPSRLWMCLNNDEFCRAARYIRIVLLGGEIVSNHLADKFYAHSDGVLMNMYGPTEATVFTTMGPVTQGEVITIGAPLQNTRTYVLDENLSPVIPTGCGELYIAGECLSAGYISRNDLTEASFVEDIYFPGKKMYRSGDLVRLRLDGRFDYIGRKDKQVKLNGQRVELSEITGALETVPGVYQAAVVAVTKEQFTQELCAFCVCDGPSVGNDEIIAKISTILPGYMVPARLYRIAAMPMTSTNKIDMQTLLAWANDPHFSGIEAEPASPEEAPENVMDEITVPGNEAYILSVWSKVLGRHIRDTETSFFKLGGTSMAALTVLSQYYNDHLELSLTDFYENPTVKGQVAIFEKSLSPSLTESLDSFPLSHADGKSGVLLTGSTGFFGIHLLNELLAEDKKTVICLVRGGNRERLFSMLNYYFGEEQASAMLARITVLAGDLAEDRFGLSEADYIRLREAVTEIYHCAADVRHYAADETAHMQINVEGTERLIKLALEANAKFYHMSTCSVGGEVMKDGTQAVCFTEHDFDIGQVWERNVYVKSKFLAEQRVKEAMEAGLQAKIFRLGRLVGRASDGVFQINPEENAFYLLLRGIEELGCVSEKSADIKVDVMPVDIGARQVMALRESTENVFHIMHDDPPTFGEVIASLSGEFSVVNDKDFMRNLCRRMLDMDRERMALVMNNSLQLDAVSKGITVTNHITQDALKAVGFATPAIPLKTVLKEFKKGE